MLLQEARTTLTQIAKKCKISIPSIKSRINKLKRKGIINGAIMQINPQKLGFTCCGVLDIITEPNKEEITRKFLNDKHFNFYDYRYFGNTSIVSYIALREIADLARTIEQIKANCHIKKVKTAIWSNLTKLDNPENLILSTLNSFQRNKITRKETVINQLHTNQTSDLTEVHTNYDNIELNKVDKKIIEIISKNAQIPFSKIAQKVGIATSNVINRYKKLRKNNVITLSSITLNLEKLGYNAMAVIFLKASPLSTASMLYKQIIQTPNFIVSIKLIGPLDLLIVVPVKNLSDVLKLKEKIYRTPGVETFDIKLHEPYKKWPLNIFSPLLDRI